MNKGSRAKKQNKTKQKNKQKKEKQTDELLLIKSLNSLYRKFRGLRGLTFAAGPHPMIQCR